MRQMLLLLFLLTVPVHAQNDGTPARTWTMPISFTDSSPFTADADSAEALTLPALSVIERVYWSVDSATSAVDSVQLRGGDSQSIIATYIPPAEGGQAVTVFVPNIATTKGEPVRLHFYGTVDAAGRIRATTIYRELN